MLCCEVLQRHGDSDPRPCSWVSSQPTFTNSLCARQYMPGIVDSHSKAGAVECACTGRASGVVAIAAATWCQLVQLYCVVHRTGDQKGVVGVRKDGRAEDVCTVLSVNAQGAACGVWVVPKHKLEGRFGADEGAVQMRNIFKSGFGKDYRTKWSNICAAQTWFAIPRQRFNPERKRCHGIFANRHMF